MTDFADIPNSGYFALFDGHAGKSAATLASKLLLSYLEDGIKNNLSSKKDIISAISNGFHSFNEDLCSKYLQDNSGCTALVTIFFCDPQDASTGHLFVANVGDSLAVLIDANHDCVPLSKPHTTATESSLVFERGGFIYGSRVNGILAVTRSFGDISLKPYISAVPFVSHRSFSLSNPPHSLILACDGLWDVCSFENAAKIVRSSSNPTDAAESLTNYAIQNNSTDNVTCMVIFFGKDK